MRRAVLLVVVALVVVAAAVLALAGGVVLAESKTCVTFDCVGTRGADTLTGRDAPDLIAGMEGNDQIDGRGSSDTLYDDEGNDTIHVNEFNGASIGDTVNCGPARRTHSSSIRASTPSARAARSGSRPSSRCRRHRLAPRTEVVVARSNPSFARGGCARRGRSPDLEADSRRLTAIMSAQSGRSAAW